MTLRPITEASEEAPPDRVARAHAFAAVHASLLGSHAQTHFGRLRLDGVLGTGGQGRVFSAYDPRLDRQVALKLRRADSPGAVARALAEGRALAKVSHPNLVPIYEVVARNHNIGLVMEIAQGQTLRQWQQRTHPREHALDVLVAVARGLVALHEAELVHGDVKPDNVVLSSRGVPRLVDLGLARSSRDGRREGGTPAYMAPEQRTGGIVGPAADQYAWALMAWETLTGQRPRWPHAVLPGARELPARLAAILGRGLQTDPRARFADLKTLVRELERWRRGRRRWRTWAPTWLALGGLAAGVIGTRPALATVDPCGIEQLRTPSAWRPDAREQLRAALASLPVAAAPQYAEQVVARTDRYVQSLQAANQQVCVAQRQGRSTTAVQACLQAHLDVLPDAVRSLQELDAASLADATGRIERLGAVAECLTQIDDPTRSVTAESPRVAPALAADLGRVSLACGAYADASCGDVIARVRTRHADQPECDHAPDLAFAEARWLQHNDRERARERLDTAAWTAERCGRTDTELHAKGLAAVIAAQDGDRDAAHLWLSAADAALERIDATAPQRARHLETRAGVAAAEGHHEVALRHRLEAIALWRALGDAELDALGRSLGNAARDAIDLGELTQADAWLREAITLQTRIHGHDHPDIARQLSTRARIASQQQRYDDAIDLLQQATTILERWHEPTLLAAMLNNMGVVYQRTGQRAEALHVTARAYEIKRRYLADDDPRMIETAANLGRVQVEAGQTEQGLALMEQTLQRSQAALGPEHAATLVAKGNLASAAFNVGRYEQSARHACNLYATRVAAPGLHPDIDDTGRVCWRALGQWALAEGRARESR